MAGQYLVCAIQITTSHSTAWERFCSILGPGRMSLLQKLRRVREWRDAEGGKIYPGKMPLRIYSVNCAETPQLRRGLPGNCLQSWSRCGNLTRGSFFLPMPVPFSLSSGDKSSFCFFIHWESIAFSASAIPRLQLLCVSLFLSFCCLSCPEEGSCFFCITFFSSDNNKQ